MKVDSKWQFYNSDGGRIEKGLIKGDNAIFAIKDGTLITDGKVDVEANENGQISVI